MFFIDLLQQQTLNCVSYLMEHHNCEIVFLTLVEYQQCFAHVCNENADGSDGWKPKNLILTLEHS